MSNPTETQSSPVSAPAEKAVGLLLREGAWGWEQRAAAAEAFLRNYADADMGELLGGYEVQPIIRRLAAAILEWQQDVLMHAPEDVCSIDQAAAADADAIAEDTTRLNFLDTNVHKFRMGWRVGQAPVGNLSIQSIIMGGQPIREAIDAARASTVGAGGQP